MICTTGCGVTANMLLLGRSDSGFESLHPDMEKFLGEIKIHDKESLSEQFPTLEEEAYKENLCNFAEQIFTSENKVGFGKTADVFKYPDEDIDLCFKHVHNLLPGNNDVDIEMAFQNELQDIDVGVKVPKGYATIVSPMKIKIKPDGRKYMSKDHVVVMEYINGCTLEEASLNPSLIPDNLDGEIFFKKLRTFLDRMHERKIYHRDLHAKNVMIDFDTGNPVVIDFGRASRSYMSEEDEKDIYASYEFIGGREVKVMLPNDNDYYSDLKKKYQELLTRS